MERENPDLNITLYDNLMPGTSLLNVATRQVLSVNTGISLSLFPLRVNVAFVAISDKNISRSALTKFCVTKTNKYLQISKISAAD
jgi:hypothetical protein